MLAVLGEAEYHGRLKKAVEAGDARSMFDSPAEQAPKVTSGELHAFVAYAAAGRLACIGDGKSVIAREAMHELTPAQRLIPSVHSV